LAITEYRISPTFQTQFTGFIPATKHRVLDFFKLANIEYWISSTFQTQCTGFLPAIKISTSWLIQSTGYLKAAKPNLCSEVSGPNLLYPEMALAEVLKEIV
jgi:hypothetical protein